MRHWLEVEPRPDFGKPLTMRAVNQGENRFEVVSENVRKFSIFLHPTMIDMDKPIVVVANSEEIFSGVVEANPALMFELAREFDDRGRVFWARVDLEIATDREVPMAESK